MLKSKCLIFGDDFMENVIILAVVLAVVVAAAVYVFKAKKSGRKCIGCPSGGSCGGKTCSCCSDKAK